MNKRAKAIEKRVNEKIEEKTKLLKNIEQISDLTINCQFTHRNPLIRVKDFTLSYDNGAPLFKSLTFDMYQHEQVAIVGPNGSGKTSLLSFLRFSPLLSIEYSLFPSFGFAKNIVPLCSQNIPPL